MKPILSVRSPAFRRSSSFLTTLCLLSTVLCSPAAPPVKPAPKRLPYTTPLPTANCQPITTTPYGLGTRTTDSSGRTWTTTPYGNGTRTTGPGGSSYTTTRYGRGTLTQGTGTPPPVIPALPAKK